VVKDDFLPLNRKKGKIFRTIGKITAFLEKERDSSDNFLRQTFPE